MEPQGWLVLGTKMNNKQLEKDLKQQRKMLEKHEKESQELLELKAKYETDTKTYEEEQKALEKKHSELKKIRQEYDEIDKKVKEIYNADTEESIKRGLAENPELIEQRNKALAQFNEAKKQYYEMRKSKSLLTKDEYNEEKKLLGEVNSKLNENATAIQGLRQNINDIDSKTKFNQMTNEISKIGKSITNVVKKVGRWALAIFGIRGAYMAVRNAINVISQGDEQLKADLDYMKNVFAYALEPLVRRIVDLAKQLLYYIAYIIKMWTGYDIFANANKNLKKANAGAKSLQKTLAGFDEMNVLNDSSGGGAGASAKMDLGDFDAPKWLKLIGKYGKTLLPILGGIFGQLFKLKKLGILMALYGIYDTIKAIINFAKSPDFDNFIKILEGIAITVIGIGVTIGAWPAIIAGALVLIVTYLIKNFDLIKEKIKNLRAWLDEHVLGWLQKTFGEKIGKFLYIPFKTAIDIIEDLFDGLIGGAKKVVEGIVKIFKGDFVGGIKDIFSGLLSILLAPFRAWKDTVEGWINGLFELFGLLKKEKDKAIGGGGGGSFGGGGGGGGRAKGGIYYPSKLPRLAVGGIINQPGAGIPYHGAYIGERGAEAVVPLTDNQQMELLGATIGKYVTINATIPVYAYNRQVDRQTMRIKAEDNFAGNR